VGPEAEPLPTAAAVPERAAAPLAAPAVVPEGEAERLGGLELRRYRRRDGRALLLFRTLPEDER
jgi:hypothetical protein